MDALSAPNHRFHPERSLLLGVLALLVAVLTGFVLGILATSGVQRSPAAAGYSATPPASATSAASALQPADDIPAGGDTELELRHGRAVAFLRG